MNQNILVWHSLTCQDHLAVLKLQVCRSVNRAENALFCCASWHRFVPRDIGLVAEPPRGSTCWIWRTPCPPSSAWKLWLGASSGASLISIETRQDGGWRWAKDLHFFLANLVTVLGHFGPVGGKPWKATVLGPLCCSAYATCELQFVTMQPYQEIVFWTRVCPLLSLRRWVLPRQVSKQISFKNI